MPTPLFPPLQEYHSQKPRLEVIYSKISTFPPSLSPSLSLPSGPIKTSIMRGKVYQIHRAAQESYDEVAKVNVVSCATRTKLEFFA